MTTQLGTVLVNEGRALPFWFSIGETSLPTQIAPDSNSPYTEDDKEGTAFLTAETGEQVDLTVLTAYSIKNIPVVYTYVSDNPTEVDINLFGVVVFQVPPEQTATATITITGTQDGVTIDRKVIITLTVSGASTINVIEGGVVGSARKALSDVIDDALSGANPVTQQEVYTSQDHVTPAYVRNTSFFLAASVEAMTCISPWNSQQEKNRAGTAVTKRHAVLAAHYPVGVNQTMRFIASDNTVITRTVVQAAQVFYDHADGTQVDTDAYMVLFDEDLPASITPCKLFPADFRTYLPAGAADSSFEATRLPLLQLDQEEKGVVTDLLDIPTVKQSDNVISPYPLIHLIEPELADRLAFNEDIILGDSGNPVFTAIGSELWLLMTFHGSTAGPFYGGLAADLNAMIVTLDTLEGDLTGYTVTEGDLSSFTDYS